MLNKKSKFTKLGKYKSYKQFRNLRKDTSGKVQRSVENWNKLKILCETLKLLSAVNELKVDRIRRKLTHDLFSDKVTICDNDVIFIFNKLDNFLKFESLLTCETTPLREVNNLVYCKYLIKRKIGTCITVKLNVFYWKKL